MTKGNGGGGKLFGADGRPIGKQGYAILKIPRNQPKPTPQAMQAMIAILKCDIIILPMEYELMMGELAKKELESIHQGIHAILDANKEESK